MPWLYVKTYSRQTKKNLISNLQPQIALALLQLSRVLVAHQGRTWFFLCQTTLTLQVILSSVNDA